MSRRQHRSTPNAALHTNSSRDHFHRGVIRGVARLRRRATTLVLNTPGTQVTDTMVQAGSFANTKFGTSDMLATRASANVEYLRRALLKFDTQNTLPAKSQIRSAVLTLTVKMGGTEANRAISVFPVTTSFVQEETTWNLRRISTPLHHGGYGTDGVYSTDRIADWVVKTNPDVVSLQEIEVNSSWSKGLDQGPSIRTCCSGRPGSRGTRCGSIVRAAPAATVN